MQVTGQEGVCGESAEIPMVDVRHGIGYYTDDAAIFVSHRPKCRYLILTAVIAFVQPFDS